MERCLKAGTADTSTVVAAVYGPSMQGKPERRLAATKTPPHAHLKSTCVCVYSPTLPIKMLGFSGPLHA